MTLLLSGGGGGRLLGAFGFRRRHLRTFCEILLFISNLFGVYLRLLLFGFDTLEIDLGFACLGAFCIRERLRLHAGPLHLFKLSLDPSALVRKLFPPTFLRKRVQEVANSRQNDNQHRENDLLVFGSHLISLTVHCSL